MCGESNLLTYLQGSHDFLKNPVPVAGTLVPAHACGCGQNAYPQEMNPLAAYCNWSSEYSEYYLAKIEPGFCGAERRKDETFEKVRPMLRVRGQEPGGSERGILEKEWQSHRRIRSSGSLPGIQEYPSWRHTLHAFGRGDDQIDSGAGHPDCDLRNKG